MKGKILITFFVALFLLTIIPYDSVKAVSTTTEIDFELPYGVKNTQFDDGFLKTTRSKYGGTKDFNVTDVNPRSGVLGFHVSAPTSFTTCYTLGWFNFTYSKSLFMTNIKMGFGHVTASAPGYYQYVVFYNRTTHGNLISSNPPVLVNAQLYAMAYFCITSSGANYYLQTKTGQQKINNSQHEFIEIEITNNNGYQIDYYTNYLGTRISMGAEHTPYNSTSFINDCRIDSCIIFSGVPGATGCSVYYDDLNFTTSTSYTSGVVTSCGYNLGAYQKIGIDNTPNTADISSYQLMKIYNVFTSGTLNGVSLCVSPSQYAYDSNLNNYTCTLLGFDLGGADCFDIDGFMYRLFWSANINLGAYTSENQQSGYLLYAQFFHTKKLWGNTYWQVCIGSQDSDLDSDGNTYFKYGSTTGVPQTRLERDLGVSFYVTGALHNATYGYNDRLGLHNYVGSNSTGFQYTLGQPEGIVCSYLLDSGAYSYKLEIQRNGTLVKTNFNLQYPSGVIGYIPTTIGRYTFKLYSYHYVYNITAYVSGTLPSFFISTDPVITNPFQSYDIFYKFYHAQGLTGIIGIFHSQSDCNDFNKAFQHIDISNNVTSTVPYTSTATTNEFLTLFINSTQKSPIAYAIHVVRNPNVAENYILVSSENIEIVKGNPTALNVTIYGNHLFPLCDIGIYIDGALKKSVKYEQVFSYDYVPLLGGEHNISLRVMMNGTLTTVSHCHLTVTIINPEEEEGGGGDLGGLLPPPYSYIMGAIITIALMILPSIALGKIGISGSETLKYVPIFSGTMGFILSCLIGFFPWYSIFALLFVLILIITVLYLSKNKQ